MFQYIRAMPQLRYEHLAQVREPTSLVGIARISNPPIVPGRHLLQRLQDER